MKVVVFSTKSYDRHSLDPAAKAAGSLELDFFEERLTAHAAPLAAGAPAVCLFVNDEADKPTLDALAHGGCKLIALRCAGYNNVDIPHAASLGIKVVRVPAYSPYAVAEHTLALMLTLNRKTHRAYNRVRDGNFALDGLLGFDMHGSIVGIVGTGQIGTILAKTLAAMGCRVLGHDPFENQAFLACGGQYVDLPTLFKSSDIISLHCPLTPQTHYLINTQSIEQMKHGVMLINTGRGALIDTKGVIKGLKSGKIGYLGLDVYEQEASLFFENLSETIIQDDVFQRLLTFPNVIVTGHQGYFTSTALKNIADCTIASLTAFRKGLPLECEVLPPSP
jgi:D-lactate dehydrogenase